MNWNPLTTVGDPRGEPTYDRLVTTLLTEQRFKLEAAASLETPDPLKIAFKLIPGMVFQDLEPVNGRPLMAEDIAADQQFITQFVRAFDRSFQSSFLESVETPDNNTVIYNLKKPHAYLFGSGALGNPQNGFIIPAEILDNLDNQTPVGSGPYQLTSDYELGSSYAFERFDKFRGVAKGLPYIDEWGCVYPAGPCRRRNGDARRHGQ